MPIWALGFFSVLGKHIPRIFIYGAIILGIGFFLYSAFLKPTSSTNIKSGGSQIINYNSSDFDVIPILGCSAWRFHVKTYYERAEHLQNSTPTSTNNEGLLDKLAFWRRI